MAGREYYKLYWYSHKYYRTGAAVSAAPNRGASGAGTDLGSAKYYQADIYNLAGQLHNSQTYVDALHKAIQTGVSRGVGCSLKVNGCACGAAHPA